MEFYETPYDSMDILSAFACQKNQNSEFLIILSSRGTT
jgi:hypothetical protein